MWGIRGKWGRKNEGGKKEVKEGRGDGSRRVKGWSWKEEGE